MQNLLTHTERASEMLKLVSHPHRLMILCLLAQNERSVNELVGQIGINQTAVSNHLARLRSEGAVDFTRHHRVLQYRITSNEIKTLLCALDTLYAETRNI